MMLVVVDVRMERFTIYQRGISEFAEYTFEDIKRNNKNTNATDIMAILKSYNLGSPSPL